MCAGSEGPGVQTASGGSCGPPASLERERQTNTTHHDFLSEALTESRSAEREASEAGHAGKEAGTRAWRMSEDVSLH